MHKYHLSLTTFYSLTQSFMKLITYTDGGSRGNPGPSATGIVIKNEQGEIIANYGEYLGTQTNNYAEYSAIISALKKAKELHATEVDCIADSKLVIEQLSGKWKVKEPTLQKLWLEAWNLLHSFKAHTLSHTLRSGNTEADAEVNKILDEKFPEVKNQTKDPIPEVFPHDAKRVFKGKIFDVYQWEQKLFDGTFKTFERIARKGSANIIAVHNSQIMILMQEQPGSPLYPSLPGGQIEKHEDPLTAAKRELLEETGYESEELEIYKTQNDSSSKVYFPITTFISKHSKKIQEPNLDPGEKIQVTWVNFDDFLELARDPHFAIPLFLRYDMWEALLDSNKKESLRKTLFGD